MNYYIPKNPILKKITDNVFALSVPIILEGETYWHIKYLEGLETIVGEKTYNVYVCDHEGVIQDCMGLCDIDDNLSQTRMWLHELKNILW